MVKITKNLSLHICKPPLISSPLLGECGKEEREREEREGEVRERGGRCERERRRGEEREKGDREKERKKKIIGER